MPLQAGTNLGPYQISGQIGEGGMGEVYRAKDSRLGRTVAIKVMRPGRGAGTEGRRRLLAEARAVSALNHPGIVTLYDVGEQNGSDYLVFEHVQGKTLDQLIPPAGMKLAEALRIGIAVADAVAAAHGAGILHRDLKPANIIVTEQGAVKVLDFGIAQLAEPKPRAETEATMTAGPDDSAAVGTPAFMSPEQAEGRRLDTRSDVFSFGAMLYEMLTGQRAFTGDSTAAVLSAVLRETPRPPSALAAAVPRELDRLIERCLRKDPARRLGSMHDVRVVLEDIRDAPPAVEPAPPSANRRFNWLWAASVAAAAFVGWMLPGSYFGGPPRGGGPRRFAEPVPLTSYPGDEVDPEFSPDGSQVAFAWSGSADANMDIYVKIPGSGAPLRLTTDPARDRHPAWSPDGQWIYFIRFVESARFLYRVAPIGGGESRIGPTKCVAELAWTPKGDALTCYGYVSNDEEGAYVIPKDGGEERLLQSHARIPRVSPDGKRLLFAMGGGYTDIYMLPLDANLRAAGPPEKHSNEKAYFLSAAWLHDGREYLAAMGGGMADSRLYRFGPPGMHPFALPYSQPGTFAVATSRNGAKTAWAYAQRMRQIWTLSYGTAARHPVSSTRVDYNPQFSPDGKRIVFESTRSGSQQIWVAEASGDNPIALTSGGRSNGTPRWSPDGKWIAFDRRTEDAQTAIFVVDSSGGRPRQLTRNGESVMPSFSRDGKWVWFNAEGGVHRVPFDGGPHDIAATKPLAGSNCSTPFEGPDGTSVFCLAYRDGKLMELPIAGGTPKVHATNIDARAYQVERDGVWFMRHVDGGAAVFHYDLATGKTRELQRAPLSIATGFTVSSDRKHFLFTKSEDPGADIYIVDNPQRDR